MEKIDFKLIMKLLNESDQDEYGTKDAKVKSLREHLRSKRSEFLKSKGLI